jgi:CubicO group peptidase (beta-lactamase class C family)
MTLCSERVIGRVGRRSSSCGFVQNRGRLIRIERDSLEEILQRAVDAHQVRGAALAVRSGLEVIDVVTGVVSNTSRDPVTTATLFPIGSITKRFLGGPSDKGAARSQAGDKGPSIRMLVPA